MQLLPSAVNSGNRSSGKYDERVMQVDLRLTRTVRVAGGRLQGIAELDNATNTRPAQAVAAVYGPTWQLPAAILGASVQGGARVEF